MFLTIKTRWGGYYKEGSSCIATKCDNMTIASLMYCNYYCCVYISMLYLERSKQNEGHQGVPYASRYTSALFFHGVFFHAVHVA